MKTILLPVIAIFIGTAMASEAPKALVIQTLDEQHIGFTLFHPDLGATEGDCVFVIVPKNSDLLATKEVSILLNIKEAGEHHWSRSINGVVVSLKGIDVLQYRNNGTLVHLPTNTELGIWFSAKAKH